MTTSMQSLILDRITAAVAAHDGVLLAHDRHYANTGTLRTLDADTLASIAACTYDFQSHYVTFGPMDRRVASHWYDGASGTAKSIPELIDQVTTHLLKGTR